MGEVPCQGGIFAQSFPCGKNHHGRKNGKTVTGISETLCKLHLHIHILLHLWKTPVEKPVEIVENCELSTGIPSFFPGGGPCGKLCISLCIIRGSLASPLNYVTTRPKGCPEKPGRKSLQIVKKCCQGRSPSDPRRKNFVKNRQRNQQRMIPSRRGILFVFRFF